MKSLISVCVISLGLFFSGWWAVAHGTQIQETFIRADGTAKYKQALDWAQHGNFDYHYEYKDIDPQGKLKPIKWPLLISDAAGKEHIAYPEAYAVIVAAFIKRNFESFLLSITLIPLVLELILLSWFCLRVLNLSVPLVAMTALLHIYCTPFFFLSFDLMEIPLAVLANTVAVVLLFATKWEEGRPKFFPAVVSGLSLGMGLWLRQESLISFVLLCGLMIYRNPGRKIIPSFTGFIGGFGVVLLIFVAFNEMESASLFGRRLVSVSQEEVGFWGRIEIIKRLLFLNSDPRVAALGVFLQMPFLLLLIPIAVRRWKSLDSVHRGLLMYGYGFLLVVVLVSPNGGWGGWGSRYCMFANFALLGTFVSIVIKGTETSRITKVAAWVLVVFALALAVVGMKTARAVLTAVAELQNAVRANEMPIVSVSTAYYWSGRSIRNKTLLTVESLDTLPYAVASLSKTGGTGFCLHYNELHADMGKEAVKYLETHGYDLLRKDKTRYNSFHCYAMKIR